MGSYYDSLIAELMGGGMANNRNTGKRLSPVLSAGYLPQGVSAEDVIRGALGGGIDEKTASRLASGAEDVMLRGALGGEYKKGKGDGRPSGSYAGAEFPGMRHQLWALESGMMPKGVKWDPGESQREEAARRKKQEEFARFQRQMLGMGGGQPRRNSTLLDRRQRYRR